MVSESLDARGGIKKRRDETWRLGTKGVRQSITVVIRTVIRFPTPHETVGIRTFTTTIDFGYTQYLAIGLSRKVARVAVGLTPSK